MKLLLLACSLVWFSTAQAEEIIYRSIVNWDYSHRNKLAGWMTTSEVIKISLLEAFPQMQAGPINQNVTVDGLTGTLQSAARDSPNSLNILYLAAHQSAEGEWDFPNDRLASWKELLTHLPSPVCRHCAVIIDTCHAISLENLPGWARAFPGPRLYASRLDQETLEIDFTLRHPVDYARRFPVELAWLKKHFGPDWQGRISFLGLMWLQAVDQGVPAGNPGDWFQDVARRTAANAEAFRTERSHFLASEIRLVE